MTGIKRCLIAAALSLLADPATAMGLRTQFGEVVVKNLFIGQTYSLNKLMNLPLRVVNTGNEPIDLQMDVLIPGPNETTAGYETIPTGSWVKLEKTQHLGLGGNQEAVSDVILSIPEDPALMGRRFKVYLWSHTINRSGVAVGVESTLLLNIASRPPGEEEKLRSRYTRRLANVNFSIMPNHAAVSDVPLGKTIDLKKDYKVSIKLVNPNDEKVTFHLAPRSPVEASVSLVDGYDIPPNANFLKIGKELLEVDGNSIGEAEMTLQVPDLDIYAGKSWLFVVSADLLEQDIPTHFNYRLLVTTAAKKGGEKDSAKKSEEKH